MTTTDNKSAMGHFIVKNDKGLHTRPCTELVKCTNTFRSEIFLTYQKHRVNAKSILGILMLAANKGSKIGVQATGLDAEEALAAIIELAQNKFYIHY